MNHDVIAVGASAGGFEVLMQLVRALPADFPGSIFVAVHLAPELPSQLPELLSARGPLRATYPLHGEKIAPGHIYVAPPDNQLLVRSGTVEVVRGPKENGHRPAVDALFRTAASAYESRVVGVVLSGYQDCGTAGMMSVKARGGLSVVQDPQTAQVPEMPRNVLERVPVDYIVKPAELGDLLVRLALSPAGPAREPDRFVGQLEGLTPGSRAEIVCPICQGVLTEAQPGVFEHFRCHVGHAFSLESLVREQSDEIERALWSAVRALEEGAALSERVARGHSGDMRTRFIEKGKTSREQAELLRQILLHGSMLSSTDAKSAE